MIRRTRSVALLAVLAAGASVATACGPSGKVTHAESEGDYFQVGKLKYQVQISRPLNPRNGEDAVYLEGLGAASKVLANGETWFGVFIRVENETKGTLRTASDFSIEDTQDDVYQPEPLSNPFAYKPVNIAGDQATYPSAVDPAHYAQTQGKILVFKLPVASLDNRPLELVVADPSNPSEKSTVVLDV